MTVWEDNQSLELLELLPRWEERRKYREQKALGNVPEVQWWEALAFLESATPTGITDGYEWSIAKKKRTPKSP